SALTSRARLSFPTRRSSDLPPGLVCFQYHVFIAAMTGVVIADDAYAFMVAWEAMALASFFLVTTEHRIPEIRRAGFLYLLIAHRSEEHTSELQSRFELVCRL